MGKAILSPLQPLPLLAIERSSFPLDSPLSPLFSGIAGIALKHRDFFLKYGSKTEVLHGVRYPRAL